MDEETREYIKNIAREAIREYLLQSRELFREHDLESRSYSRNTLRRLEQGVDEFSSLLMRFSDGLDTLAGQNCGYDKAKVDAIKKGIDDIKSKV